MVGAEVAPTELVRRQGTAPPDGKDTFHLTTVSKKHISGDGRNEIRVWRSILVMSLRPVKLFRCVESGPSGAYGAAVSRMHMHVAVREGDPARPLFVPSFTLSFLSLSIIPGSR